MTLAREQCFMSHPILAFSHATKRRASDAQVDAELMGTRSGGNGRNFIFIFILFH
jgi:hypothetical protein